MFILFPSFPTKDTVEATATPAAPAAADGTDEERVAQLAARRPEGAQLLSEVCRRIRDVGMMGMGKLCDFGLQGHIVPLIFELTVYNLVVGVISQLMEAYHIVKITKNDRQLWNLVVE